MKPLIRIVFKLFALIYLALSDCDGMCEHCSDELKFRCKYLKRQNHKMIKNGSPAGIIHGN
jgi:hypothetical protein